MILIPVFNDWASLSQLLPKLDAVLAVHFLSVDVMIVETVQLLHLRVNSRQARMKPWPVPGSISCPPPKPGAPASIAVGLAFIEDLVSEPARSWSWTATARMTPPTCRACSNDLEEEGTE